VLLADPAGAVEVLSGVDPAMAIPRYTDHNWPPLPATPLHIVDTVGALLARPLTDAPDISGPTILVYNDANGVADSQLSSLSAAIQAAFGLTGTDIARFPVLFDHVTRQTGDTGAVAITPDLINGSIYNGWYLAPDPFLRQMTPGIPEEDANGNFTLDPGEDLNGNGLLDTQEDPFKQAVQSTLPPQIPLRWLDDWVVYHINDGEVHCSSNEIRVIPAASKWWEISAP